MEDFVLRDAVCLSIVELPQPVTRKKSSIQVKRVVCDSRKSFTSSVAHFHRPAMGPKHD